MAAGVESHWPKRKVGQELGIADPQTPLHVAASRATDKGVWEVATTVAPLGPIYGLTSKGYLLWPVLWSAIYFFFGRRFWTGAYRLLR